VPAGLSGVVAVAGGETHSLALKNDGTVVAWGLHHGQGTVPADLRGVVAVAAGGSHNLALQQFREVSYDDGAADDQWSIGQAYKTGVMFSRSDLPYCRNLLSSVRLWTSPGSSGQLRMFFLDSTFAEIRPPIFTPVVQGGWNDIDVSAQGIEVENDVLIAVQWVQPDGSSPDIHLGYDLTNAQNFAHSYEYNLAKWGGSGWRAPSDPSGYLEYNGNWMIRAVFEKAGPCLLTLARAGAGSGTISSNPSGINCGAACSHDFARGTLVTLTAVPAAASRFNGWDACPGFGTCQLTIDEARTITATFSPALVTYTITASVLGGSGSITPLGPTTVVAGGSQAYVIAPAAGYRINYVAVNGASVGAVASYTVANVSKDTTIRADFVPVTYAITVTQTPNGTVTPSTYGGYRAGTSQTFSVRPNTGYHVTDVVVDGASVGAVGSYTVANIQANHAVTATFAANPSYTITASGGTNGAITPAGTTTLLGGQSQKYTIVPSAGFRVGAVLVDGVARGAITSFTFSTVSASHTIEASFVRDEWVITASVAGGSGTITPLGDTTVPGGGSQTYAIAPAAGYKINYVAVNGASVGKVTSYTFSNVRQGYTIRADFVPITYTITVTQTPNGYVTPYTYGGFTAGTSQTYAIKPNTGYVVTDVLVDGASVGAVTSYTFTGIAADHAIAATFAAAPRTLSVDQSNTVTDHLGMTGGLWGQTFVPNAGNLAQVDLLVIATDIPAEGLSSRVGLFQDITQPPIAMADATLAGPIAGTRDVTVSYRFDPPVALVGGTLYTLGWYGPPTGPAGATMSWEFTYQAPYAPGQAVNSSNVALNPTADFVFTTYSAR
jgi:hypothetical protein